MQNDDLNKPLNTRIPPPLALGFKVLLGNPASLTGQRFRPDLAEIFAGSRGGWRRGD
jgi:hypothetical protein